MAHNSDLKFIGLSTQIGQLDKTLEKSNDHLEEPINSRKPGNREATRRQEFY